MMENETLHEEPMLEEEMLLNEGETVVDAFVRHQRLAAHEARLAFKALIPEGTRVHGKAARHAFRKAFKVVLDDLSARLEFPEEDEQRPSSTGPKKVKIEVS